MRVLSLFDGISCGALACARAKLDVDAYYAYEIDPVPRKVSETRFPQITHLGDVCKEDFNKYLGVELLIGGVSLPVVQQCGRANRI